MVKSRERSVENQNDYQCNIRFEELIRYIDFFSAKYNQTKHEKEQCEAKIISLSADLERSENEKNSIKQLNENYSTQIESLTSKIEQMKALEDEHKKQNQKLNNENNIMSNYIFELISTCDSSFEKQSEISNNQSDIETMSNYIWELIDINDKAQKELDLLKKAYGKQKMQISYLQAQTERYQRTINSVTNKWYGKIALKLYHFIRKIGLIK